MPRNGAKYRHYKGGEYVVVGTSKDPETSTMNVLYRSVGNEEAEVQEMPLAVFLGPVKTSRGDDPPRFKRC